MTRPNITPGPWKYEGINVYAPAPASVRPHVAKVIYGTARDARAIAALPDLLEVLESLLYDPERGTHQGVQDALTKAGYIF